MVPTSAVLRWGFPRCWQQAYCLFLPEVALLVPGAPLAAVCSLAGRALRNYVLPAGLGLVAAAMADVLLE